MKIQRLKRKNSRNLILDMTPLIDVVFLLLIFFMVATTFQDVDSSVNIELPKSSSEHKITIKTLEVKINKDLEIYLIVKDLNGKNEMMKVEQGNLKEKLGQKLELTKDKNVIVSADKSVNYQSLIEVLDIAKEAGAGSLDLNTKSLN
ncbi:MULTISPECIES: ExbD/TolR family protein [Psychrilyobacter]|uniref:Biopolymer transporter ExbD n=1 Tax=Psychrilyobacter piezotolerans TaxID=2293438 RepID=A0ABX9KLC7_9FUSO|nr:MULTISPECIES: biopolymer transporter ExbD [Psychrilyobacter]MCS5421429.1 biopolymer transporter ExbD [Psychrilyobacter sp. S5]NDI76589.1 biopolymer transporter ExbD [Psychrilyobacter piezotolerans]RDE65221.1 biopolymer transporter ExbD [Psychrilyobacter sp. S5]REI42839.1 biopolymer transporter ExbD [Psychrilyobacter piezotolerans]